MHHTHQATVIVVTADAHRPLRVAPQVVGGAIQGVNQPPKPRGAVLGLTRLLTEDGVVGALGADHAENRLVGLTVGVAHQIGGAALLGEALRGPVKPGQQLAPCDLGGAQRYVEHGICGGGVCGHEGAGYRPLTGRGRYRSTLCRTQ